jgi:hypothetical protein
VPKTVCERCAARRQQSVIRLVEPIKEPRASAPFSYKLAKTWRVRGAHPLGSSGAAVHPSPSLVKRRWQVADVVARKKQLIASGSIMRKGMSISQKPDEGTTQ